MSHKPNTNRSAYDPAELQNPPERWNSQVILPVLMILTLLIYSNTFQSPFIFDDLRSIVNNHSIRITELAPGKIWKAATKSPLGGRPVANVSFALNYLLHRYDVSGYHLVNLLIHLCTGLFLFFFIRATLLLSNCKTVNFTAFAATLIWLVHPIQTQSVTYIVQRMNSMAAMFYILSLLLYVKGRMAQQRTDAFDRAHDSLKQKPAFSESANDNERPYPVSKQQAPSDWQTRTAPYLLFSGSLLSGLFALGSKEIAATLPVFIFLYEWYFFQGLNRAWIKRRFFIIAGILLFLVMLGFFFLGESPFHRILAGYGSRQFTLLQRVLTELRVVIFYISLLLLPHPSRLSLTHDFPLSTSLIQPLTTLFSLIGILLLLALVVFLARRQPLISFSLLWFLGHLVIESTVLPLEIIFEHRTYLPSMLVGVILAVYIHRLVRPAWVGVAIIILVTGLFSYWTYDRNNAWRDKVTFWKDCVTKSPDLARPYINLGVTFASMGRLSEATDAYYKALEIDPDESLAHYNLGKALFDQGQLDRASAHFLKAIHEAPSFEKPYLSLGNALVRMGRTPEAIEYYTKVLEINPQYAKAHNSLGVVLAGQGNHLEAAVHYNKALTIDPEYAEAHNNLGATLRRQGKIDAAVKHYLEALRLNPNYAEAYNNLGLAMLQKGKINSAVKSFQLALSKKPGYEQARKNLAAVMKMKNSQLK